MAPSMDTRVIHHIEKLVEEEQRLYAKEGLEEKDRQRITQIGVELDQCWDFLRQRRALRDAGKNPDEAHLRPPEIVEKYLQ